MVKMQSVTPTLSVFIRQASQWITHLPTFRQDQGQARAKTSYLSKILFINCQKKKRKEFEERERREKIWKIAKDKENGCWVREL